MQWIQAIRARGLSSIKQAFVPTLQLSDDLQYKLPHQCESGGIGRRTRLRIWRRKAWGFESPLSHQTISFRSFDALCLLRISAGGSNAAITPQLRIWRRRAWGFESPLSHQQSPDPSTRFDLLRISAGGSNAAITPQLRIWRRKAFEFPLSHQNYQLLGPCL